MIINPNTEQPTFLIGKTITDATIAMLDDKFDDEPLLHLKFSDGTETRVIASYGSYTGRSENEYPRFIRVANKQVRILIKTQKRAE